MRVFVSIERHEPFQIVAVANVADTWERNEHGYGSFGRGSIPYPGNRSIEVSLNFRVRPRGHLSSFPTFPTDLDQGGRLVFDGDDRLGLYAVKNGRAGVLIAAGVLQSEMENSVDAPLYFAKIYLVRGEGRTRIQMNVSIAICSAPAQPIGDIPEWDVQFFQGGLPSLGKRRP